MTTLAVVANSARLMAEAATRDGYGVVAVDLFGDVDTRRACGAWLPAGPSCSLRLDVPMVLAALRQLARRGDVAGWVPGGGCEGEPLLLAEGAELLPLIGTAPPAVRRLRDPLAFFDFLAGQGIEHPEVRSVAPADGRGWLVKDAQGCGGWHIRDAASASIEPLDVRHYFQRRVEGTPMSATFCANGSQAVVLGFNQLLVRALGTRPYVCVGVIGPVTLPAAAARQVTRAVRLLTAGMALQGLCSLDFMLDGDTALVLEVNPRPPASMALYGRHLAGGVMAAHVDACMHGRLPVPAPAARTATADAAVQGFETVFAPQPLRLDAAAAAALQAWPDCHDLPSAGTLFACGDPVCSLGASAASAAQVSAKLDDSRTALLQTLEALP